jgi:hypothetical protein
MKRCPKCRTDYFDNMLDFCLDDGERLLTPGQNEELKKTAPTQAETVAFDKKDYAPVNNFFTRDAADQIQSRIENKSEKIKQEIKQRWVKWLEIMPIIPALAHIYWQWLYLSRKYYYQFYDYFFSSEFIIWLLLLIITLIFGIISLKFSIRKDFAITALIVLAINVLLSIVPK